MPKTGSSLGFYPEVQTSFTPLFQKFILLESLLFHGFFAWIFFLASEEFSFQNGFLILKPVFPSRVGLLYRSGFFLPKPDSYTEAYSSLQSRALIPEPFLHHKVGLLYRSYFSTNPYESGSSFYRIPFRLVLHSKAFSYTEVSCLEFCFIHYLLSGSCSHVSRETFLVRITWFRGLF